MITENKSCSIYQRHFILITDVPHESTDSIIASPMTNSQNMNKIEHNLNYTSASRWQSPLFNFETHFDQAEWILIILFKQK